MPNYIRAKCEGGHYFFTIVTYERIKLFNNQIARQILKESIEKIRLTRPFETIAFCLLPDHIHCIWKLPENDADFSKRWSSIKGCFSRQYSKLYSKHKPVPSSQARKGEVCIWQRRFWEHLIRDNSDLHRHINYIHYNPVKHGLVERIEDWQWSTYHKYVKEGFYGPAYEYDQFKKFDSDQFGE